MDIDRLIARDNLEELDSLRAENASLREKKVPLTVGDAIDTLVDILYSDIAEYLRPIEKRDIRYEFEQQIVAKAKANEKRWATTLCEKLDYNYCPYCGRPVEKSEVNAE